MMSKSEKNAYIFSSILQTLINAFAISLIIFLISMAMGIEVITVNDEIEPLALTAIVIIGIFTSSILTYLNSKSIISKSEKAFKTKDAKYFADID